MIIVKTKMNLLNLIKLTWSKIQTIVKFIMNKKFKIIILTIIIKKKTLKMKMNSIMPIL